LDASFSKMFTPASYVRVTPAPVRSLAIECGEQLALAIRANERTLLKFWKTKFNQKLLC